MPWRQTANIAVEDARTLTVTPWEKGMVSVIEKAIMSANLGFTPVTAGTVIRVPLPVLTEERHAEGEEVIDQRGEIEDRDMPGNKPSIKDGAGRHRFLAPHGHTCADV